MTQSSPTKRMMKKHSEKKRRNGIKVERKTVVDVADAEYTVFFFLVSSEIFFFFLNAA